MKKSVPFLLLLFLLPSVLFAVSFLDGRISFNVPNALEIRSNQYEQIFSRVADDAGLSSMNTSGEDSLKVVLQQKGLNTGDSKANSQYCRITISVSTDDSSSMPNWLMRESIASFSTSEKAEYEALLRSMTEMSTTVINWYPTTYEDLGGLFAIRNHYTRKSTAGNASPVEVYSYTIQTGIYTITIFCSYRQSQAVAFVPAINEFLESVTFNFSEDPAEIESLLGSEKLYTHNLPGTNVAFSWPEPNLSWTAVDENSIMKAEQLVYSNLFIEGYFSMLVYLEYKTALTRYQMSVLFASTMNEALTMLRMNTLLKDLKLLENSSDSNSARVRYSYTNTVDGSTAYGFAYWLKINSSQIISVSSEYYSSFGDNPEAILQSFLDSLKL